MLPCPRYDRRAVAARLLLILISSLLAGMALHSNAEEATSIPEEYQRAQRLQQTSRFTENDIKSVVYHLFALYDKHADVEQLLPLFADQGLEMRLPETTLRSHDDFKHWYAGIGETLRSNRHRVERVDVALLGSGRYAVEVVVLWQAVTQDNRFVSFRAQQHWALDEGEGGAWPRIVRYEVKAAQ